MKNANIIITPAKKTGAGTVSRDIIAAASKTGMEAKDLRVSPVVPVSIGQTTEQAEPVNINLAAKGFEPAVDQIVGILDGAGVRLLTRRASRLYSKDKVEIFAEACRMDDETRTATKKSLSRIAARRIKNEELMDFLTLGGAMVSWGGTIMDALAELKAEEKERKGHTVEPTK